LGLCFGLLCLFLSCRVGLGFEAAPFLCLDSILLRVSGLSLPSCAWILFSFLFLLKGINARNGWGATIVDGLSTLLIADMQAEVFNALNYTVNIDFTSPDGLVDPFETIIR
jgi:Glycosyl hydrolase family 47